MAAYVAALHRKNDFKIDLGKYGNIIDESDIEVIEKLGILLRICENLDRGVNNNVSDIYYNIESNTIIMNIKSKTDPFLEISQALECTSSFEKITGKKLIIQEWNF